jgi:hypothetical protein
MIREGCTLKPTPEQERAREIASQQAIAAALKARAAAQAKEADRG